MFITQHKTFHHTQLKAKVARRLPTSHSQVPRLLPRNIETILSQSTSVFQCHSYATSDMHSTFTISFMDKEPVKGRSYGLTSQLGNKQISR
jgi:hypothetical protein